MYTFDEESLRTFIDSTINVALISTISPAKDFVSQREAYEFYGETRVKEWINEGKVSFIRKGKSRNSKKEFSRKQLATQLLLDNASKAKLRSNR